jgi:hypothetical protein
VTVILAAADGVFGSVNDTSLENVVFARNEVFGGLEGLYVFGGFAGGGGAFKNAAVQGVSVLDNYFHDITDASMGIEGTEALGAVGSDGSIEDVTIAGNRIEPHGWGIGVWGGEAFVGAAVKRGRVSNLNIKNNDIVGDGPTAEVDGTWCIILETGRADFAPSFASNNSIRNVRITDNRMKNCTEAGVAVHGGVSPLGSRTTGNSASRVLIARNTVKDSGHGVTLRGAYLEGPGGTATGNAVSGINIVKNTLVDNTTAIALFGALAPGLGVATANELRGVTIRNNTVRGGVPCVAVANSGPGAVGNRLYANCPPLTR